MSFPGAYTAVEHVEDCQPYKTIYPEPFPQIPTGYSFLSKRVIQERTQLCSGPLGGCHPKMKQCLWNL